MKQFPSTDLASNAQFYLGEIAYQQGEFKDAIAQYNLVLQNYPQSYKQGASLLKKGLAEISLGTKASGIGIARGGAEISRNRRFATSAGEVERAGSWTTPHAGTR